MRKALYASIFRRGAVIILDLPFIIILYYFCDSICIFVRDAWGTLFGTHFIMYIVIIIVYYCAFECSSLQGSIGKMLMGIQVCKNDTGERISFVASFVRSVLKILSLFILPFTILLIILTKKHQGLHDIIVGTVVINEE